MNKSKQRCALVGVGNRAHSWLGGIVEQHSATNELVGLCDTMVQRCHDANKAYGTQAAVFTDHDRMLAETTPDLVVVTSPERYHAEHIVKALDAGCRVATEKPLCTTFEDAQAILDAERRHDRRIFMAFNYRHIPLARRIKELLLGGAIGRPVSMDLTWYLDYKGHGASYFRRWHRLMRESGGLLITKASHHFDLANWWMNDYPVRVSAEGDRHFFGAGKNPYQGDRCRDCEHAEKCEWYTDVCVRDRTDELSRELGYQVKSVRDYPRDHCPFGDEVDIYDTMSVQVRYAGGGSLTYSLNASVPFEGWNLAINGTGGRLESAIVDNKPSPGWQERFEILDPDGKPMKGKGFRVTDWPAEYTIHVMPHDELDYRVQIPNVPSGHGGGDFKIFDAILGDNFPQTDELGIFASAIHGALSTAIGAAANISAANHETVDFRDRVEGWLALSG